MRAFLLLAVFLSPKFAVAVLMTLVTTACDTGQSKMKTETVSVRGVEYDFPASHVTSAALAREDTLFVRLAPPGANFHLILDVFHPYLPNKLGPDIPTISTLKDNQFEEFRIIRSKHGPIVCQLGPQPHFDCGFEVEDGQIKWSVLFDEKHVDEADEIRIKAISLIESYKSAHAKRS